MIHPTDLSTLTDSHLSEREALVAAAVLPHLPDDDALVRIHDRDRYETGDRIKRFKEKTPTIAGTRLRRVTIDFDAGSPPEAGLRQSPHGTRTYRVNGRDFDAFRLPNGDEADFDVDFDDTDQAFLSDFGFEPSPVDAVHLGVNRTDDTFERKPVFPA